MLPPVVIGGKVGRAARRTGADDVSVVELLAADDGIAAVVIAGAAAGGVPIDPVGGGEAVRRSAAVEAAVTGGVEAVMGVTLVPQVRVAEALVIVAAFTAGGVTGG